MKLQVLSGVGRTKCPVNRRLMVQLIVNPGSNESNLNTGTRWVPESHVPCKENILKSYFGKITSLSFFQFCEMMINYLGGGGVKTTFLLILTVWEFLLSRSAAQRDMASLPVHFNLTKLWFPNFFHCIQSLIYVDQCN